MSIYVQSGAGRGPLSWVELRAESVVPVTGRYPSAEIEELVGLTDSQSQSLVLAATPPCALTLLVGSLHSRRRDPHWRQIPITVVVKKPRDREADLRALAVALLADDGSAERGTGEIFDASHELRIGRHFAVKPDGHSFSVSTELVKELEEIGRESVVTSEEERPPALFTQSSAASRQVLVATLRTCPLPLPDRDDGVVPIVVVTGLKSSAASSLANAWRVLTEVAEKPLPELVSAGSAGIATPSGSSSAVKARPRRYANGWFSRLWAVLRYLVERLGSGSRQ